MLFLKYKENLDLLDLPFSLCKYKVDIKGNVYFLNNKIQESTIIDNERHVYLEWVFGKKYYPVRLLVAYCFKPLYFDFIWWEQIDALPLDGDKNNIHPSNLIWKFPKGLGSSEQNGFAYIPMFTRYLIDRTGYVFDTKLFRLIKGHYNSGYHAFSLMSDLGVRCSLKRHRALALAFMDYPLNVDNMQVNHINGKSWDDRIENFEWVTGSENILHAFRIGIKKPEPTPIVVRNLRTNTIQEFESVNQCALFFNKSKTYIGHRLRQKESTIHEDGLQFKRKSDLSPWYTPVDLKKELFDRRKILVKNVVSKEILEFDTAREVSYFLNVSESNISKELSHGRKQKLYKKYNEYYIFKYKFEHFPWRDIKDPITEYNQDILGKKSVILRFLTTGEIKEYSSAIECAKDLNILPTTLNYRLSFKGQKIFSDGTQVKYKSDLNPFCEPDKKIISIFNFAPIS